jgi:hypothetical protein
MQLSIIGDQVAMSGRRLHRVAIGIASAILMGILLMALGGTAQAAVAEGGVLCSSAPAEHNCSNANVYEAGTNISATMIGGAKFTTTTGSTWITCSGGSLAMKTKNSGGVKTPVKASNTAYSLTGCTFPISFLQLGESEIKWEEGTHNGVASQSGNEFSFNYLGAKCVYGISGPIQIVGGSAPKLVEQSVVHRLGSCPGPAEVILTTEYEINTPTPLYVEHEISEAVLCKTAGETCSAESRYPAGTKFESALKSGTKFSIGSAGGKTLFVQCESGSLGGEVTSPGGVGSWPEAALPSVSLGGCSSTVTIEALPWHATFQRSSGGNGTMTLSDFVIHLTIFGGCTYQGKLPLQLTGGEHAELVANWVPVTRSGASLCPATGYLSASYLVGSPSPLYVSKP